MNPLPLFGLTFLLFFITSLSTFAEDWNHWRGQNRDDHISEKSGWTGTKWPLTEAWEIEVGEGSTSPIVVGNHVITMGYVDGQEFVRAFDLKTGKPIWSQSYAAPRYGRHAVGDKGLYFGTTASPEFDEETKYVYTLGCDGELACWDTANAGAEVWRKNLYDIYKMEQRPGEGERHRNRRDYGYICAPRVYQNWLLVETGGNAGTVCAFDKRTGKQVWASQHKDDAGHSGGIVIMNVEGKPCLGILTFQEFLVMRLDADHEGETVGTYAWPSAYANNLLTPTVQDDKVLISSWHSFGKRANPTMHQVRVTLKGIEKVWEQPVSSHLCSPIIANNRIYIAGPELYCLDFKTGETIWKGAGFNYGGFCTLTQDDRLVVLGNRGKLRLIDTVGHQQTEYRELALQKTLTQDDIWSQVVISHGYILCKDVRGRILCLQIGE
jgi:outer membrane protein assembly factor BamB